MNERKTFIFRNKTFFFDEFHFFRHICTPQCERQRIYWLTVTKREKKEATKYKKKLSLINLMKIISFVNNPASFVANDFILGISSFFVRWFKRAIFFLFLQEKWENVLCWLKLNGGWRGWWLLEWNFWDFWVLGFVFNPIKRVFSFKN